MEQERFIVIASKLLWLKIYFEEFSGNHYLIKHIFPTGRMRKALRHFPAQAGIRRVPKAGDSGDVPLRNCRHCSTNRIEESQMSCFGLKVPIKATNAGDLFGRHAGDKDTKLVDHAIMPHCRMDAAPSHDLFKEGRTIVRSMATASENPRNQTKKQTTTDKEFQQNSREPGKALE